MHQLTSADLCYVNKHRSAGRISSPIRDATPSFSFLRTSVSTMVLVSDKVLMLAKVLTALNVLTMGGLGGG